MVVPVDFGCLVSMILWLGMVEDQQHNSSVLNEFLRDVVHDRSVLPKKQYEREFSTIDRLKLLVSCELLIYFNFPILLPWIAIDWTMALEHGIS